MYKSSRMRAKEFMDKLISNLGTKELDYDKILAVMMTDASISPSVAKETLDAFIQSDKLVKEGEFVSLPLDKVLELKNKQDEIIQKELKEAGLS